MMALIDDDSVKVQVSEIVDSSLGRRDDDITILPKPAPIGR
jgi:hypothetical protein